MKWNTNQALKKNNLQKAIYYPKKGKSQLKIIQILQQLDPHVSLKGIWKNMMLTLQILIKGSDKLIKKCINTQIKSNHRTPVYQGIQMNKKLNKI